MVGRKIGDYELISWLAQGGMGVVYRARQVTLNRLVAVKLLRSGTFATPEEIRRFLSEAQAAGRLEHPHIVPVFEVGEYEGRPFYSMALIHGKSLYEYLREGPLSSRQAVTYVAKVTTAMAYAHGCGVLHRDIKPQNILIDEHDQPRLTDFGLAKSVSDRADMTGLI